MASKSSNGNTNYINQIKLKLDKLKNGENQNVKVDLTKINIKKLASQVGLISQDVKLFMKLLTSNRYYALNDKSIDLLMKGDIDMSATSGDGSEQITESDSKVQDLLELETEVEIFIVDKNKTRAGGSFFPYLNNTIFDLHKYGIFKQVDKNNYKHNCLYLALKAGGLSDIKLQELVLTLKNRHIHKCDLSKVCDALNIHIELISIKNDGLCRNEHYGKDYDEKYDIGLVKGHYFINDCTEITSYCLEHYDEIKDMKDCHKIEKKVGDKFKKCNTRFIKAFQLFKILMDNVDTLIIPIPLTEDIMRTQFYDKVNEYETLEYTKKSYKLEEYKEKDKTNYKIFFDFETITSEYKHMPYLCWIYNNDIQQELIGINNCAVDMLNASPTDKGDIFFHCTQ